MLPEWIHRSLRIPYILSVKRSGKKGSTIIFLHGLAGQKEVWDELIHRLGRSHRCIAIDLLGHGQSPKPTGLRYDVTTHLRSIRWTLFWRGIRGAKTIVGHSMGTIIAVDWAYRHPGHIDSLVLASVPIYNRAAEAGGERSRFEAMIDAAHLIFYRALRSMPRPLAIKSARMLEKRVPSLRGQVELDEHTWYPVASSLENTIENQNASEEISRLSPALPIIVIGGDRDRLAINGNSQKVFEGRYNTRFIYVECGHQLRPEYFRAIEAAIKQA